MSKKQIEQIARKTAIYSRKSKYTGKGESIENQIEMCRRYAETILRGKYILEEDGGGCNGCDEIMAEREKSYIIYEDEGFSGGNLERPQFRQMMEDARAGKISHIIVYRLDRISRNIGDFAGLIQELNGLGVEFISIREQFDTSSPLGRAMMYIASVFSQLERETIAERIRDNMLELAKTGRWLGGKTPTGYGTESVTSVTVDGRIKKCCKLKLIPEEAEVVREIFFEYLRCGSLKETAEEVNRKGLRTKTGKEFTPVAVRAILSNPVYAAVDGETRTYFEELGVLLFFDHERECRQCGILAYNRTLQQPGKTNQLRDIHEWVVAAGKHEPIITGEDWVRVQKRLEGKRFTCR